MKEYQDLFLAKEEEFKKIKEENDKLERENIRSDELVKTYEEDNQELVEKLRNLYEKKKDAEENRSMSDDYIQDRI